MPVLSKEFLDIHATIECGLPLKCIHDMIGTYSHIHLTDKYSQHRSIIWPVWLNGWVFVYKLSHCGFKSCCNHLRGWLKINFKVYYFINFKIYHHLSKPLNNYEKCFLFHLKALFVIEIFSFLHLSSPLFSRLVIALEDD